MGFHGSMLATPAPRPPSMWVLGSCLYVVGSVFINLGENVVRMSHTRNKRSLWVLGISVFLVGNLFNFVALNLAAQSLLEGLGAVQFLSNLLFAYWVLGEQLARRHALSTSFIIAGNALVVMYGDHETRQVNADVIAELAARPVFIIYVLVVYTSAFFLQLTGYMKPRAVGFRKVKVVVGSASDTGTVGPMAYAAISAMIGGNSVLLGKACTGLIRSSLSSSGPRGAGTDGDITIIVVVLWLLHMSFWAYRLNFALKRFPSLFIIPVLQSVWIIVTILSGGIFFDEFRAFTPTASICFSFGLLLVLIGVLSLIRFSHDVKERSVASALGSWLDTPLNKGACVTAQDNFPVTLSDIVVETPREDISLLKDGEDCAGVCGPSGGCECAPPPTATSQDSNLVVF
mmetsp:Transcript_1232/g.2743  ORF Transcript_1232/g.2743 Transcript_1232/m.2743 type:complete len:401 (+) Transcript_1232:80-1282(+)